jgi:hypothetical protein
MKKVQAAAVEAFKSRVDRLAESLSAQGYDVQHMHLIEGVARYEGARDWRTLRAQLAAAPALAVEAPGPDANADSCLIAPSEATDAQSAAMSEMLYEWDDNLSFADILAILRGSKQDGNVNATTGFTHLTREQLADELENLANLLDDVFSPPPGKCTSPVEDHALSCLEFWGSLSYLEILEILDSEDPERRKEIDVHPSLVGFSNSELSEIIRREHRWAMRNPRLNPTRDLNLDR